ncbi:MAG: hypothetical protein AAB438_02855 [Patescibacteria group bacterium]
MKNYFSFLVNESGGPLSNTDRNTLLEIKERAKHLKTGEKIGEKSSGGVLRKIEVIIFTGSTPLGYTITEL